MKSGGVPCPILSLSLDAEWGCHSRRRTESTESRRRGLWHAVFPSLLPFSGQIKRACRHVKIAKTRLSVHVIVRFHGPSLVILVCVHHSQASFLINFHVPIAGLYELARWTMERMRSTQLAVSLVHRADLRFLIFTWGRGISLCDFRIGSSVPIAVAFSIFTVHHPNTCLCFLRLSRGIVPVQDGHAVFTCSIFC